jgi:DnaJ-class molecular chaperone
MNLKNKTAKNLFENLGLNIQSSVSEINKRVTEGRKLCHPEWISRNKHNRITLQKHLELADEIRFVIDETAEILCDDEKREAYITLLKKNKKLSKHHGGIKTPFEIIKNLIDNKIKKKKSK